MSNVCFLNTVCLKCVFSSPWTQESQFWLHSDSHGAVPSLGCGSQRKLWEFVNRWELQRKRAQNEERSNNHFRCLICLWLKIRVKAWCRFMNVQCISKRTFQTRVSQITVIGPKWAISGAILSFISNREKLNVTQKMLNAHKTGNFAQLKVTKMVWQWLHNSTL